jgi:hypothetical protein
LVPFAVLLCVALCAACGRSSKVTAGSSTGVKLTVEVRTTPGGAARTGTLTCDGAAGGTGMFADAASATAACATVTAPGTADLLADPHPAGQACSQLYGGPETATVKGTVSGRAVDAQLGRTDGCETATWERLRALVQP